MTNFANLKNFGLWPVKEYPLCYQFTIKYTFHKYARQISAVKCAFLRAIPELSNKFVSGLFRFVYLKIGGG